ncbi:MAG: OmpA family protein [Bacteroidota bacterium]
MKNHFFLLLFLSVFFLSFSQVSYSQASMRLERADKAFEMKQYSEALKHYDKVYKKIRKRDRDEAARIIFNMAMSFRYLQESRRAEAYFRRLVRTNYPDSTVILYMAQAMMQNEKFEDAKENFQLYQEKAPDDWRAELGLKSIELQEKKEENPGLYQVEMIRALNSRDNDFTPVYGDNLYTSLIFASSRDESVGDKTDMWTGEPFTSLFVSYLERTGEWTKPTLLDEGPVNTEFNEGAPSVNAAGNELYFTRCQSVPDIEMGCRIYKSERQGSKWGEPTEVVLVTDSTISVGHPAISYDDMRLYFVSDMPGGVGGKDIWYAERETAGGDFKNPKNAGEVINTPGNEVFPSVREDGTLFFASNGHPGFGGLDIFYTQMQGDSWTEPENMNVPVNSHADDFGITFKGDENEGFFSSNRREIGMLGDGIFYFYLVPVEFTIQGTIRDDSTKNELPGAQIQLIGNDGSFAETTSDEEGKYFFDKSTIKKETSYEILVSLEDYFNTRGQETTIGIARSRDFVNDYYLAPIPDKPIELPEILYEFAQWELLPQYKDSLNGLVTTLKDNPEIVVELASHTDSRGSDEVNDTLSQKRAQTVVDYLIEQGIEPERLVAKGYGKRVPRVIPSTITREGYTFEEGTELTEEYINALPDEEHRDIAHQLNRRTEFSVIRDDFEPDKDP